MKKLKWPKKHCAPFDIPIYGGEVCLFKDPERFKQAYRYLGCEPKETLGTGGCTHLTSNDGHSIFLVHVSDGKLSTLVHELLHVVYMLFDHIGAETDSEDPEPSCYLMNVLFEMSREIYTDKFGVDLK